MERPLIKGGFMGMLMVRQQTLRRKMLDLFSTIQQRRVHNGMVFVPNLDAAKLLVLPVRK